VEEIAKVCGAFKIR